MNKKLIKIGLLVLLPSTTAELFALLAIQKPISNPISYLKPNLNYLALRPPPYTLRDTARQAIGLRKQRELDISWFSVVALAT